MSQSYHVHCCECNQILGTSYDPLPPMKIHCSLCWLSFVQTVDMLGVTHLPGKHTAADTRVDEEAHQRAMRWRGNVQRGIDKIRDAKTKKEIEILQLEPVSAEPIQKAKVPNLLGKTKPDILGGLF